MALRINLATLRFPPRVILLSACVSAVLFLLYLPPHRPRTAAPALSQPPPQHVRCSAMDSASASLIPNLGSWETAKAKFANLTDDKFTIAIQTYHRVDRLRKTLDVLLSTEIPSLQEIVIVWNNVDMEVPDDFVSKHNVPVRYRASSRNSLNQKLWLDPDFTTQAILLSDDDVYYQPSDLEFVFQTWRKFGQDRLSGGFARCAYEVQPGRWEYRSCSRKSGQDVYSMILTGLAFSHISFLDFYSSDDAAMTKVRAYVDDKFNCEDIALNVAASLLTQSGPLLVAGHQPYFQAKPAVGLSRAPDFDDVRSQCLNDFADFVGCLPLVNETAFVRRGLVRNTWLQVLGDVLGVV